MWKAGNKYVIQTCVNRETFEQIERERKNFSRSSYVACVLEEIFKPELNGSENNA